MSAMVQNAVSAFRSTGIVPLNPTAVPDHAFLLQPLHDDQHTDLQASNQSPQRPTTPQPCPSGIQSDHFRCIEEYEISPGKALDNISPVPLIMPFVQKVRKTV